MGWKIEGKTSPFYAADVDSTGNLFTTLPQAVDSTNSKKVGYAFMAFGPNNKAMTTFGPMGRLPAGVQTMEIFDPMDGAAINPHVWNQAVAGTMTIVQNATTGFLILNAAASTAINNSAQITTIRQIQLINTFVPTKRFLFKTPNVPQANAIMEIGFLEASGVTAPVNGAIFRWDQAEFRAHTIFNSAATSSGVLANPAANVVHTGHITFRGTKVEFWLNEVLVAEVTNPAGNPTPTNNSRIQLGARVYTLGTVPVTAPELHIAAVSLWRNDLSTNKPWPAQMAGIGRASYQSPVTPFAQTANHANSTSPASAALSNTAAGYTTWGGRFQFAAPAGAATDFALFGAQVPAGFQAYITDFRLDMVNTGAAVAITPTIIDIGVGINSSAVSLATADSFTTNVYGPKRIPLGHASWIVGDAIGLPSRNGPIGLALGSPWVIDSLRFLHLIIQVYAGTATVSQVIRGDLLFGGYME